MSLTKVNDLPVIPVQGDFSFSLKTVRNTGIIPVWTKNTGINTGMDIRTGTQPYLSAQSVKRDYKFITFKIKDCHIASKRYIKIIT